MKKFAIITKSTKIDQPIFLGEIRNNLSNKVSVWKFLGIPFFRETVTINDHA